MSKTLFSVASAALLLGPLALAVGAGGCGPSRTSTLCEALCTCTPCTENDRADCEASADDAEQKATAATCAEPFDAYLGCAIDNVRCRDPQSVNTACIEPLTALVKCDNAVPILGTICEAATVKIQVCLSTSNFNGGQGTCLGQQACNARCTTEATCAAIQDVFSSAPSPAGQPLLDCFNACAQPPGQ